MSFIVTEAHIVMAMYLAFVGVTFSTACFFALIEFWEMELELAYTSTLNHLVYS